MGLFLGSNIKGVYCGATEVKEANIGSIKVYGKQSGGLIIDGLSYRIAEMPDGRIWMCENCQAEQGSAVFYKNDESTYGRNGKNYGRLYNWNDAMFISNRVDGWHLASLNEWEKLAQSVGGNSIAGKVLKSLSGWDYESGSDNYDFTVYPSGYFTSNTFYKVGTQSHFWTSTEFPNYQSVMAYRISFVTNDSMQNGSNMENSTFYSVRLVKDV